MNPWDRLREKQADEEDGNSEQRVTMDQIWQAIRQLPEQEKQRLRNRWNQNNSSSDNKGALRGIKEFFTGPSGEYNPTKAGLAGEDYEGGVWQQTVNAGTSQNPRYMHVTYNPGHDGRGTYEVYNPATKKTFETTPGEIAKRQGGLGNKAPKTFNEVRGWYNNQSKNKKPSTSNKTNLKGVNEFIDSEGNKWRRGSQGGWEKYYVDNEGNKRLGSGVMGAGAAARKYKNSRSGTSGAVSTASTPDIKNTRKRNLEMYSDANIQKRFDNNQSPGYKPYRMTPGWEYKQQVANDNARQRRQIIKNKATRDPASKVVQNAKLYRQNLPTNKILNQVDNDIAKAQRQQNSELDAEWKNNKRKDIRQGLHKKYKNKNVDWSNV